MFLSYGKSYTRIFGYFHGPTRSGAQFSLRESGWASATAVKTRAPSAGGQRRGAATVPHPGSPVIQSFAGRSAGPKTSLLQVHYNLSLYIFCHRDIPRSIAPCVSLVITLRLTPRCGVLHTGVGQFTKGFRRVGKEGGRGVSWLPKSFFQRKVLKKYRFEFYPGFV